VTWTVDWTSRAQRDLRRLDRDVAARVVRAVGRLADGYPGDVVRLQEPEPIWRLRVGDWRVRFRFEDSNHRLLILRVLPRGRAYRD
jgi:mRNA interferase RelE/StbE